MVIRRLICYLLNMYYGEITREVDRGYQIFGIAEAESSESQSNVRTHTRN